MHLHTSVSGTPSILTSLSGSSLTTSYMPHEKPEKDDYPGVQFWTRADWTKFDDNTDVSKDLGRGMQFLEDKDSCVITPMQASLICDQACSIWNQSAHQTQIFCRLVGDKRASIYVNSSINRCVLSSKSFNTARPTGRQKLLLQNTTLAGTENM
jgi:hypothetical protein